MRRNSNRNRIQQVQLSLSSRSISSDLFFFFLLGWKSDVTTLLFRYSVCARTRYRFNRFNWLENVVSFIPLLHLLFVLCNPLRLVRVENCSEHVVARQHHQVRSFLKELKIRIMSRGCDACAFDAARLTRIINLFPLPRNLETRRTRVKLDSKKYVKKVIFTESFVECEFYDHKISFLSLSLSVSRWILFHEFLPDFRHFSQSVSSDRTTLKKRFPFPSKRRREREVATEGKEVPSLNRSGFYFVRVCLPLGLLSRP